jgi:hypothetical protein
MGSASAALTGLIFVAVSVNRDRIVPSPTLRAIAVQTLMMFVLPLGISIVLLTPRQASWVVGTELMALGVMAALVITMAGRHKKEPGDDAAGSRLARVLDHNSPNLLTAILTFVAGGTLIARGLAVVCTGWYLPSSSHSSAVSRTRGCSSSGNRSETATRRRGWRSRRRGAGVECVVSPESRPAARACAGQPGRRGHSLLGWAKRSSGGRVADWLAPRLLGFDHCDSSSGRKGVPGSRVGEGRPKVSGQRGRSA